MTMEYYRYERFDTANNKEVWRRVPGWRLWFAWLRELILYVLHGCKHNRYWHAVHYCGWKFWYWYPIWLYCRSGKHGDLRTLDMLDFNQEVIK
ncbi:hypothetical protein [Bifidobacterium olomucense]|uniref:Uncharacterized protein n=1 Tax=Bifidobacterium olomucense TaxID=2675324 RepID=A0A7Y0HWA2_9BIFI|nr:hypothetical protein [Bifidobacterium sp. DSM 109959]NMM98131.1 hypothetical protein [Bifidobacterium sp. DSM 109959]